jgi:hypothetical protein
MNWRVGLLRLWVVATAIWIVSLATLNWVFSRFDSVLYWARTELPDIAGWLFIPPIVVLAVGASLAWAFHGFRAR